MVPPLLSVSFVCLGTPQTDDALLFSLSAVIE